MNYDTLIRPLCAIPAKVWDVQRGGWVTELRPVVLNQSHPLWEEYQFLLLSFQHKQNQQRIDP